MARPIFILSLPRSGSTLLQRMLASHPDVATSAEPWVLIPALYGLRGTGVYSHLNHRLTVTAIADGLESAAEGPDTYRRALRAFGQAVYDECAAGAPYFLDKTPRYHVFADDIMRAFPDGRFIFLWRSPLATVASICRTWGGGNWNLARFHIDLFDGLAGLTEAASLHGDRAVHLRYEDLVTDPAAALRKVFHYLDLEYDPNVLTALDTVDLGEGMGDQTGVREFDGVTATPLTRWRTDLGPAHRKRWMRGYLRWIGEARLRLMGYALAELERDLAGATSPGLGVGPYVRDLLVRVRGTLELLFEPHVFGDKFRGRTRSGKRHLLR